MLARGHRLRVGKQGIVGYVTGIGRARVAQSTQMDRIHAVNPELPDTRAEMGLPLKARGEIIGALDIQDTREQAFTHETIQVMQTLADQIALAIDNLRLFGQAEQSLVEAQRAYGEYSRQAWIEAQRSGDLPAYRLTKGSQTGAQKVDTDALPTLPEDRKLELPIQVRGQTIGILDIVKPGQDKDWSEEEQELLNSLSEQLGIALDSARLFNETQKRAATERLVTDVSDQIRGTLDIDTIMKTATEQIRTVLNLPQVVIRLAEPTQDSNGQHKDSAEAE
jgi:GAF domain-containing protein